jgi:hypothetical protein
VVALHEAAVSAAWAVRVEGVWYKLGYLYVYFGRGRAFQHLCYGLHAEMLPAGVRAKRQVVVADGTVRLVVDEPFEVIVVRTFGKDGYGKRLAQIDAFRSVERQADRSFYINVSYGNGFTAGGCYRAFYLIYAGGFWLNCYGCSCLACFPPCVAVGAACG